jgi:organic radical activating enzyme
MLPIVLSQSMTTYHFKEFMKPGRITDYGKTLPIIELYRCVQSEGSRFGRPTIAVRTTGCTHRCYFGEGGWCDSCWAVAVVPSGMHGWVCCVRQMRTVMSSDALASYTRWLMHFSIILMG